jgi:hypothetical protein
MTRAIGRVERQTGSWPLDLLPFESPAGLKVLVPGWPQFAWGQHERGWVLLGSFVFAMAAGFLAWGTWIGWIFFGFSFLSHVTSTTDAIRQGSFPVYPRRTAVMMISGALAVFLYLPALAALFATACPGFAPDRTGNGYLVNCWAYRGALPHRGDCVWLRMPTHGRLQAARVVAIAGQEVEWTGHQWQVDGKEQRLHSPLRMTAWAQVCRFTVPDNQVLVEPDDERSSPEATSPLVLVSQEEVVGRAWAQYYPVWDRRLL